jgi:transcriptional repressor NrdR
MRCPFCQHTETKVTDSRLHQDGNQVRRRRECLGCHERFTTYEAAELTFPQVVKQDGSRTDFSQQKLMSGMLRSLEKRPVSRDQIDDAVNRIHRRLLTSGEREIPSRQIGDWVMQELAQLDQVAYVRFASVYRQFQDVNAFREVIERLEKEPSAEERRQQLDLLEQLGGNHKDPH